MLQSSYHEHSDLGEDFTMFSSLPILLGFFGLFACLQRFGVCTFELSLLAFTPVVNAFRV